MIDVGNGWQKEKQKKEGKKKGKKRKRESSDKTAQNNSQYYFSFSTPGMDSPCSAVGFTAGTLWFFKLAAARGGWEEPCSERGQESALLRGQGVPAGMCVQLPYGSP